MQLKTEININSINSNNQHVMISQTGCKKNKKMLLWFGFEPLII